MTEKQSLNHLSEEKFQKNRRQKIFFLVTTILLTCVVLVLLLVLVLSLTGIINIPAIQIASKDLSTSTIEADETPEEELGTSEETTDQLDLSIPESKAFETPEETIEQFVILIQNNDFEGALALFAIQNMAEGFDFDAQLDRLNSFQWVVFMAPTEYKSYEVLNQAYQLNSAANNIKGLVYNLLLPDLDILSPYYLSDSEDENIDFLRDLDPSKLESLELVRIDYSTPEYQRSDSYQDSVDFSKRVYGFVDQEEYLVLYKFEGNFYAGGFTLVDYEQGWQIVSLDARLAGIKPYNMPQVTEAEYLELVGD